MNHFQPQPAGLPSGSFGARRSAGPLARPWRALLAAPHRLAFAAGSVLLATAALWWLALQLAGVLAAPAPLAAPITLAPATLQALLLGLGVWPLFLVGLLCAALPGWLGCAPLDARLLRLPLGLVLAGWVAALAGLHAAWPLAALGVAAAAVGLALAAGVLGLVVLQHRAAAPPRAALALAGLVLLPLTAWAAAVALALGQPAWLHTALSAALWLGLVPLALALAMPRGETAALAAAGRRFVLLQRCAWAWLGAAAGLAVVADGQAPAAAALLMGGLGCLVLGRATAAVLQQAGRRPRIDNAVWCSAWAAQLGTLATVAATLWPAGHAALALLGAQFWLAAMLHWAWHLRPALLRTARASGHAGR